MYEVFNLSITGCTYAAILTSTGAGLAPWATAPMKFSEDSNFDGAQQNLDSNFSVITMLKLPTSKTLRIFNKTMMSVLFVLLITKAPIVLYSKNQLLQL